MLEEDPTLAEKMKGYDIAHMKIAQLEEIAPIHIVAQEIQDKLTELKRTEVERIRKILKGTFVI